MFSINQLFSALWGAIFLALFFFVFSDSNFIHNISFSSLSASFLIQICLFLLCYGGLKKYQLALEQYEKKLLVAILFIFFIIQIIFAYKLAIATAWDVEAVYLGASNIATQGNLGRFSDYFHMFPHNLGAVILLSSVFKVATLLGIENLYAVGCFTNIVIMDATFIFVYLILKKMRGTQDAFHGLILCLTCLPLLFYVPVFYTDSLSICFALMIFYGFMCFLEANQSITKKLAIALLSGIALYLGGSIKITVIFMLIAIMVVSIINKKTKQGLSFSIIAFVTYQLLSSLITQSFYNAHLNATKLEQTKIPYSHWVMMGLKGNGGYNPGDYEITKGLNSQSKRIATNIGISIERLYDMGYSGFLRLAKNKQLNNFGNGTYVVHDMLDDGPVRKGALHEVALYQGKYYRLFAYICQGFHLMLIFMIALSAFYDAFTNKNNQWLFKNTLRMSLLGLFSFLLFWETSARYMLNYLPVFIILAQIALAQSYDKLSRLFILIKNTRPQKQQKQNTVNAL